MRLMHPRSERQTPRPGGSRGPSPRSRRCRTCPPRPDIQAAQVLPRSQPSDRSGEPYREPALPPSGPPIPYGKPPEPVSPSHIPPRRPPSGRTARRSGLSTGSDDMPRRAEALRGRGHPGNDPRLPSRRRSRRSLAPSRRPCRAVRKPRLASPSLSRVASIQMQPRRGDNNNCRGSIKKLLIKNAVLHNRYKILPPVYPQAARM